MSLGNNPVGEPLNSPSLEQKETLSEKKQIIKTVKNVGGVISSVDNSAIENKENPKNTKKDKLITRSQSLDSLNLIESHSIDEELEKIKSESPATSTADSSPTFPDTQNFSCKEALLWKIRPSYSKKDKTVFDDKKKQYVQPMNYYTHGGQQEAKIKTHMQKHVANSLPDIVKEQEFRDRSEFQLCIKNNQLSFPQVSGTNPALLAEGEYKVIVSSEDNKGLSMYANVVNETKWDDPTRASHAKFLAGNPIFFGGKVWVNNEKKVSMISSETGHYGGFKGGFIGLDQYKNEQFLDNSLVDAKKRLLGITSLLKNQGVLSEDYKMITGSYLDIDLNDINVNEDPTGVEVSLNSVKKEQAEQIIKKLQHYAKNSNSTQWEILDKKINDNDIWIKLDNQEINISFPKCDATYCKEVLQKVKTMLSQDKIEKWGLYISPGNLNIQLIVNYDIGQLKDYQIPDMNRPWTMEDATDNGQE